MRSMISAFATIRSPRQYRRCSRCLAPLAVPVKRAPESFGNANRRAVGEAVRRRDDEIATGDALDDLDAIADPAARAHALLVRGALADDQELLDTGEDDERRLGDDQAGL